MCKTNQILVPIIKCMRANTRRGRAFALVQPTCEQRISVHTSVVIVRVCVCVCTSVAMSTSAHLSLSPLMCILCTCARTSDVMSHKLDHWCAAFVCQDVSLHLCLVCAAVVSLRWFRGDRSVCVCVCVAARHIDATSTTTDARARARERSCARQAEI